MIINRIISTAVMIGLNFLLFRLIKPGKKEIKCALISALIVAAGDITFEYFMGRYKIWEYHMPYSVLGIPADLFIDFFMVCLALCQGYIYFGRRKNPRRWRIGYVAIMSLLIGTEGYFKNLKAGETGFLTFNVDIHSSRFIIANYLTITAAIILIATVYTLTYKFIAGDDQ